MNADSTGIPAFYSLGGAGFLVALSQIEQRGPRQAGGRAPAPTAALNPLAPGARGVDWCYKRGWPVLEAPDRPLTIFEMELEDS